MQARLRADTLPGMEHSGPAISDTAVEAAFSALPDAPRRALLLIRSEIFRVAADAPGVGRITETLKWGQPAYLTSETKSGTTIRLGAPKSGGFALFVHCQTRVIPEFRAFFGDQFTFDGNRAVLFRQNDGVPVRPMRILIKSALTYHLK